MKVTQVILMLILSYSKSGVVSDCFINNFLACLTRMGGPSSPSMSSSGIQDGSFHGHTLFSILMFSPSFLMARGGPKELHPTFKTSSKPWRANWFYIESFLKGGKVTQVFLLLWVSLRILTLIPWKLNLSFASWQAFKCSVEAHVGLVYRRMDVINTQFQ